MTTVPYCLLVLTINGNWYQRASPSGEGGGTLLAPVDNPVTKLPCQTTAHKFGMLTNDERPHIGSGCERGTPHG